MSLDERAVSAKQRAAMSDPKGMASSSPKKSPGNGGPGSRLCPLPKRIAKRKKADGSGEAASRQGAISIRSVSPESAASPGHVDAANGVLPDSGPLQNGSTNAAHNAERVQPGSRSAPTLELPPFLPAEGSGTLDAQRSPTLPSTSISPGQNKVALDSLMNKEKASFMRRFDSGGDFVQQSAADEVIKTWYADRVKELADGQRCELQMALLAEVSLCLFPLPCYYILVLIACCLLLAACCLLLVLDRIIPCQ